MNRSSKREIVVNCFYPSYQELKYLSFESEYALKHAIENHVWTMVYRDFSYRTLTPKTEKEGRISIDQFRKKCIAFLSRNYYQYFTAETLSYCKYDDLDTWIACNSFEDWHEKMCESLLKLINERYKDKEEQTGKYVTVTYGKAQKIVNMLFKYLYCFDYAEGYIAKFAPCHMTIDAIIIDWVADIVLPSLQDVNIPIKHSNTVKWSKSFAKGSKDEAYTYLWYQNIIQKFLELNYLDQDGNPLTPLVAEFYAWPEEQWYKATREWLSLDVNQQHYPNYFDGYIDENLKKIAACAEKRRAKVASNAG